MLCIKLFTVKITEKIVMFIKTLNNRCEKFRFLVRFFPDEVFYRQENKMTICNIKYVTCNHEKSAIYSGVHTVKCAFVDYNK